MAYPARAMKRKAMRLQELGEVKRSAGTLDEGYNAGELTHRGKVASEFRKQTRGARGAILSFARDGIG